VLLLALLFDGSFFGLCKEIVAKNKNRATKEFGLHGLFLFSCQAVGQRFFAQTFFDLKNAYH
jgi:hypothetical protein